MTIGAIIETLRDNGVDVEIGIKVDAKAKPTAEMETLIQMLTDKRDEAIDRLLIGRYVPLPDDTKVPQQFMSERMKQIRNIFAVCYRMIEKFENQNRTAEHWKIISEYHNGKLNPADDFAIKLHTICYSELAKQYQELKNESTE